MFKFKIFVFLITLAFIAYSLNSLDVEAAGGSPPPNPTIYSGTITVGGQTPADSKFVLEGVRRRCLERCITARMGSFVSDGGIVENGSYVVTFGPPDITLVNSAITFHYDGLVKADEEDIFYNSATIKITPNYNLTFPSLPIPTPTPVPTVLEPLPNTPSNPVVVTAIPVLSNQNILLAPASGIPTVSENNLYLSISGEIAYDASAYSNIGLELIAKVGSYFTSPVPLMEYTKESNTAYAVFDSLVIEPASAKFIGKEIDFYIRTSDGVSTEVNVVGKPLVFGETLSDIDIELEVGDAEMNSSNLPSTSVLPEDKNDSSVANNEVAGNFAESGTCSRVENLSFVSGSGDMLMMVAPIFLLVAYTGWRRRK